MDLSKRLSDLGRQMKKLEAQEAYSQLSGAEEKKSRMSRFLQRSSSSDLHAAGGGGQAAAYREQAEAYRKLAEDALASADVCKAVDVSQMQAAMEEANQRSQMAVAKVTEHISSFTNVLMTIPLSDSHRLQLQTILGSIITDLQPLQVKKKEGRAPDQNRASVRLKKKIEAKRRAQKARQQSNAVKFEALLPAEAARNRLRYRSHTMADFARPPTNLHVTTSETNHAGEGDVREVRRWKSEPSLASWDVGAALVFQRPDGQEDRQEDVCNTDAEELGVILRRQIAIRKTLSVSMVAPYAPAAEKDVSKRITFGLTDDGEKILVGGDVQDLWIWLMTKSASDKDLATFLLLYRRYTTSLVLAEVTMAVLADSEKLPGLVASRIHHCLTTWVELFIDDFMRDEAAGTLMLEAIGLAEARMAAVGVQLDHSLKDTMQEKITSILCDEVAQIVEETEMDAEPVTAVARKLELMQISVEHLAQQICVRESRIYGKVKAQDTITGKTRVSSPTINAVIANFNRMSSWVATEIVTTPNVKKRATVVRAFIRLAACLLEQRNFNGVLEMVAGLNQSVVQRLKKTWKLVPRKAMATLKALEKLMDPQGNHKAYRMAIKLSPLPCLPYMGIFLKDATFIDEGNKDHLPSGAANFEKMRMKAALISSMEFYQMKGYDYEEQPTLQNYLCNLTTMDEKATYKYSLQCEPRTAEM